MIIEGSFDSRTLANMEVALDRICGKTPSGEQHEVRKRVAEAIVRCARSGRTTLGRSPRRAKRLCAAYPERPLSRSGANEWDCEAAARLHGEVRE